MTLYIITPNFSAHTLHVDMDITENNVHGCHNRAKRIRVELSQTKNINALNFELLKLDYAVFRNRLRYRVLPLKIDYTL